MASMIASLVSIIVYRRVPAMRSRPLPQYPGSENRSTPMLVLGESHHHTTSGRAPQPTWLTVPQRGLYTGVMVLDALGTGKTSACMYPYVEQLLRWRSDDQQRKIGGLVVEVKGDFCGQVRSILSRAGRADDYLEIGLDTSVGYNPLRNDLHPYAVAYAIATLLNNLFSSPRSRSGGRHATFFEVFQNILDDRQIQRVSFSSASGFL